MSISPRSCNLFLKKIRISILTLKKYEDKKAPSGSKITRKISKAIETKHSKVKTAVANNIFVQNKLTSDEILQLTEELFLK